MAASKLNVNAPSFDAAGARVGVSILEAQYDSASRIKLDACVNDFVPSTCTKESEPPSNNLESIPKDLSITATPYIPPGVQRNKELTMTNSLSATASALKLPSRALNPESNSALAPDATEFVPISRTKVDVSTSQRNALEKKPAAVACKFFASGYCRMGIECPFLHQSVNVGTVTKEPDAKPNAVPKVGVATVQQHELTKKPACKFFAKGYCRMGIDCPFLHQSVNAGTTANKPHTQDQNSKQNVVQGVALEEGLVCQFGPGLAVEQLEFTCQDIRTLMISGLPPEATEDSIQQRLSKYGNVSTLTVQCNSTSLGKYATAVFEDYAMARKACKALHGTSTNTWQKPYMVTKHHACLTVVSVRIKSNTGPDSNASTVKVQWYKPRCCGWVNFRYEHEAKTAARRCSGMTIRNCSVTTKFQQPTYRSGSRGHPGLYSVWLGNLDEWVTTSDLCSEVARQAKFNVVSASLGKPPFREHRGPQIVQGLLRKHGGPLTSFDISPGHANRGNVKEKALAKFAFAGDAKRACQYFHSNTKLPELGGMSLFIQHLHVAKFTLPGRVANTLRSSLDSALLAHPTIRCSVHQSVKSEKATISISADSAETLRKIRGELKTLLSGTILIPDEKKCSKPVWNHRLSSPAVQKEVQSAILEDANAVWFDTQRRVIRIFGPMNERARIAKQLMKFLQQHQVAIAVPISSEYFERILQEGRGFLDKLTMACGGAQISLDLKSKSLLVEGSPQIALRIQNKMPSFFDERKPAEEGSYCPICFCPPDDTTVSLSICKHIYCSDCFTTWLSGANLCSFPLTCLAEGCESLVPMSHVELEDAALLNLLRASLDNHVRCNPTKYEFCPAITCPGIYRIISKEDCSESPCSSCSQSICTACRVSHSPLSCKEHAMATLPPDRIRSQIIDEILTLRCPRCQQAFLDFDGCFAIACSVCPCNFCGWCLKDCGTDAHPHVKECPQKPAKADSYFGTRQQFEEAQAKTRTKKLIEFLKKFEGSKRGEIIQSLQTELEDLNISITA